MSQEEIIHDNFYSLSRHFKAVTFILPTNNFLAALQATYSKFIENMFFKKIIRRRSRTKPSPDPL